MERRRRALGAPVRIHRSEQGPAPSDHTRTAAARRRAAHTWETHARFPHTRRNRQRRTHGYKQDEKYEAVVDLRHYQRGREHHKSSSKKPAGADDAKTAAAAAEDLSDGNGNGRTSDESQVAQVWAAHLQAVREWLPDTRAMTPAERLLIERNLEAHGFETTVSAVRRHGESYLVRKPGARHVYHLNGALGRGKGSGDLAPQHAAGDTFFPAASHDNVHTVARHAPLAPGKTGVEAF